MERGGERERRERRGVVVDLGGEVLDVEPRRQVGREAHVDVRPVGEHHLHRPLPVVMPPLVLRPLEVVLGRMVGEGDRPVAPPSQGLLHPPIEDAHGLQAALDRGGDRRPNLDPLGQDVDGTELGIGDVVALDHERHELPVRGLQLQAVEGGQAIQGDRFQDVIQLPEGEVAVPQRQERLRVDQQELRLQAEMESSSVLAGHLRLLTGASPMRRRAIPVPLISAPILPDR